MSQTLLPLVENGKRIDGYFFDPSSEIVYFFKSIDGKKVKFSTKIKRSSYRMAQAYANKKIKSMFGDKRAHIQPLIKDEIPKWLAVKRSEGLDPKTMRKIDQALRRIEPFWNDKFPREIDIDNVAAWIIWLKETYPGQQKFNPMKYFKSICGYMNQKQFNGVALLPAIPKISDPDYKKNLAARKKKTERIFTTKEFRKLMKVAEPVEWLAGQIMYKMATRIEETLTMTFNEQVVWANGGWRYIWSIGQNKADLEGWHDFPDSLKGALTKHQQLMGAKGRLFPQLFDVSKALKPQQVDWADWRKRASLGWHWTSKTFRHTCLSNLFNDPANPQATLCIKYRVSLKVAHETYIKATPRGMARLKNVSAAWS